MNTNTSSALSSVPVTLQRGIIQEEDGAAAAAVSQGQERLGGGHTIHREELDISRR